MASEVAVDFKIYTKACTHPSLLDLSGQGALPDHKELGWCTCCGVLIDLDTESVVAGPSDYRARWKNDP